jgi:formate hydrogenlyase subunit 3/multisubunit Na+/H+ antiporter MnhD subunit
MNANTAVLGAIGAGLAGAVVTLLAARARAAAGWLAVAFTAVSSALALYAAGAVLAGEGHAEPVTLWSLPALGSSLRFHVDGLSAVFLALIAVIALLAAVYSVRYMDHYRELGVGRYYPHVLLFEAGMIGIVTTTDTMAFFCAFWQLMTIPSFLLVRFEHTKRENVRAATRYLVLMEIACVLVMVAAGLLGGGTATGEAATLARFDFDRLSAALPGLLAEHRGLVGTALVLFLIGFGIKAGMWPFGQLWLPAAHPAAPSPVSALLSGVMIKTGVYGLMRTFFWLVPAEALAVFPAGRWGALLAVLGTVTLFVGTLQALKQDQTKRLLAFSSIGQVGYILFGLGIALVLIRPGQTDPALRALAALGFAGALFHTINHALFKSLLFLNAGSMLAATGTQDLNRLGGLMRLMPLTGITTMAAAFSISGIFNGFASKWSLYVAAILGAPAAKGLGSTAVRLLPLCGVVAVLTGALTLALFLKFFGSAFLARPSAWVRSRAEAAPGGLEAGGTMIVPQVLLAAACLLLGLIPLWGFQLIKAALAASRTGFGAVLAEADVAANGGLLGIPQSHGEAVLAPLVLLGILGAMTLLAWWLSRLGGAARRETEPWLCGYVRDAEAYRYHARSLYGEVTRHAGWVGGDAPPAAADGAHAPAAAPGDGGGNVAADSAKTRA